MNKILKKSLIAALFLPATLSLEGCLEEDLPTDYGTQQQIDQSSDPAALLTNGLNAIMVMHDTYGVSGTSDDWGYPCQMFIRDILCEDFPIGSSSLDYYYSWIANGTYLNDHPFYSFYFYYYLNANACKIIGEWGTKQNATTAENQAVGVALSYRALAYLDMARLFEYKTTGFSSLDSRATDVLELTVPIVTEATTDEQAKQNPRAPFYTMYRFILSDLTRAEKLLDGYKRSAKSQPDQSVAYGLEARLWLEMATRFEHAPADLALQLQHEADNDGYQPLGVTTAQECYAKAAACAKLAMQQDGYQPLSRSQWYDTRTGFNSANTAWMWAASMGAKEQIGSIWYSWMCNMSSESPVFSWGSYMYHNNNGRRGYRCIGRALYNKIPDTDWRKKSWVAPSDVDAKQVPAGYSTLLNDTTWCSLDTLASLKFHPGSGNVDDYNVGVLCDVPLMRVEEMYFIYAEAVAHSEGLAAGKSALESFMNTWRYTDGSYKCDASSLDDFTDELMIQKRIEFWGEGLVYFDYKRLAKQICRYYDGSNFPDDYQLNSRKGYVAPWLNYTIPQYEQDQNPSVLLNPDPSNAVKSQTEY